MLAVQRVVSCAMQLIVVGIREQRKNQIVVWISGMWWRVCSSKIIVITTLAISRCAL